jgi:glycosyltransferase involved in cell wall biosynthesis
LELLADEKLRQAMGARGRMEAESRYTWKRIFADMSTFYKGLLEHA